MIVAILINSKKYKYHQKLTQELSDAINCETEIVDMADGRVQHEYYQKICDINADLIITLDCAGFELRTESDSLSLNNLHSRIVNILLRNTDSYREELSHRQNLSMFTYLSAREINDENALVRVQEKYPDIPNLSVFCGYDYNASSETDMKQNRDNITGWVAKMLEDVRL